MRVKEVHFNHDVGSAKTDAINLGQEDGSLVTAPEWVDGDHGTPVAYARNAVKGPVKIKAKFSGGPPNMTGEIRAVAASPGRARELLDPTGRSSILGDLKPSEVSFDAEGRSGLITFQATGLVENAAVGVTETTWTWQANTPGGWQDFFTTRHRIYVTVDLPKIPWRQDVAGPWLFWYPVSPALEKACEWATGTTTVHGAIEAIARAIYEHPKHTYDESTYLTDSAVDEFELNLYLQQLETPGTFTIDCTAACAVLVTFANLLGANLNPLSIHNSVAGGFHTRKVLALNDAPWAERDWGRHEVVLDPGTLLDLAGSVVPGGIVFGTAWTGGLGREQVIYDACLRVDSPSEQPVRMPLGVAGQTGSGYRDRLILTGDGDQVTPKRPRKVV